MHNNPLFTQEKDSLHRWLAAVHMPKIGPRTIMQLVEHFGGINHLFSADITALRAVGLNDEQCTSILSPSWTMIAKDLDWLSQGKDHHILTIDNHAYPKQLKEISDPPLVLYVKGKITSLSQPQVAIVGARSASKNGCHYAKLFAEQLSRHELIITSGLALGIDAASHEGALAANGETFAVIGSGLKHMYPHKNRKLADKICDQDGAIISEFPVEMRPLPYHFPRRNRIIAGLSLGVLVIEAALKSGSLITARYAVESGRDVFAMPGALHDRLAKGCHHLIKQGAKLVECPQDILEELQLNHAHGNANKAPISTKQDQKMVATRLQHYKNLSSEAQHVLDYIRYEVTSIDSIIIQSGLTTSEVSSILLSLELQGFIHLTSGGYVRTVQHFE